MSSPTLLATLPTLPSRIFSPLGSQFLSFHPLNHSLHLLCFLSRKRPLTPNSYSSCLPMSQFQVTQQSRTDCPVPCISHMAFITRSRSGRLVCLCLTHLWTPRTALPCHTLDSLLLLRTGRNSSEHPEPLRCQAPQKQPAPW